MQPDWYKNAVVYTVDIRRYADSDGDGVGDFRGLLNHIDYLHELGITCLWLLPFFPSPDRDGGYDVTNYYEVDPRFGTLDDFVTLVHRAGEHGIRVLVDLPANHTSDRHPWFEASRREKRSRFREYYTWSDQPPRTPPDGGPIVGDMTAPVWTYDDVAEAYFYHRFYDFEPDLNHANPEVRSELLHIMDFWLSLGVSGFRIDAVPIMIGTEGPVTEQLEAPHSILKELRRAVEERRPDAVLLGEVDVPVEELVHYFGDDDELHLLFNFLLNNYIFLGLARGEHAPIVRALRQLPSPPTSGQWANFLRNLDELDLEQLTEDDRREVYGAFAPEPEMRIYGRGLRRRLAPILGGERRRMELAFSLLFSIPGIPVVIYGDEIGMGDDLGEWERMAVRPPMQWSSAANGGFSTADPAQLVQPMVSDGPFGFAAVNVEEQRADPDSFLRWIQRLILIRRQCEEMGHGTWRLFDTENEAVLAHRCAWRDGIVVAVHNLGGRNETVTLDLRDQRGRQLADLLDSEQQHPLDDGEIAIELEPYGYRWYRVVGERRA